MSSASRKPCAWHAAALEFGKNGDTFVAIDPRTNPKSWAAWRDYFRWLNWAPHWFIAVERAHDEHHDSQSSWTAPVDHPDKFTVAFQPVKGHPPVFPLTLPRPSVGPMPGHVERLRAEGKLTYHSPEGELRKPWFHRLTSRAAQETLDRFAAEVRQDITEQLYNNLKDAAE